MHVFFEDHSVNLELCDHFEVSVESGAEGGVYIKFHTTTGEVIKAKMESYSRANAMMRTIYNKLRNGELTVFISERPRKDESGPSDE